MIKKWIHNIFKQESNIDINLDIVKKQFKIIVKKEKN